MTQTFLVNGAPQPVLLNRFRKVLLEQGSKAVRSDETLLTKSADGRDQIYYVPFEHMNRMATLVIVGITPGPHQIKMSYEAVQARLKAGLSDELALERAKTHAAFGDYTMRPNLIKMLDGFGISALLGLAGGADLWRVGARVLHATSVIPHAAFRNGKPFAGTFEEIMASKPFRECFERDFASTLPLLSANARYIALGPTPLAALDWCCEQGLLNSNQILGAFAHPSTQGGSQVPIYLGEKRLADLATGDPVKKRTWLLPMAERMSRSVESWRLSKLAPNTECPTAGVMR